MEHIHAPINFIPFGRFITPTVWNGQIEHDDAVVCMQTAQ